MYCVIYKFIVHSSKAEDFIAGWKGLTQETYKNERSLGSRLHKVSEMEYLAYAQWPSKEVYENANNMSEAAHRYRNQMRESCVSIEVLNEMQVVEDLLDNNPQRKTPTSELHFVIYGAHIKSEKQKEYIEGWKGLTELIVAANRHGENGTAFMEMRGGWFDDISQADVNHMMNFSSQSDDWES